MRVCVRNPATGKWTTVSIPRADWTMCLGYTEGNAKRVTDSIRYVAGRLTPVDVLGGGLSALVRRKAIARLRGQVTSADARQASENNAAWS